MSIASSRRLRTVAASILVGSLAGCASPTASEHFYALNDGGAVIASPGASASAATERPGIVVSAVTIPELVDRPQIVTRDSTNRVIVSEQNLWAESIRSGFARTLAARVATAMNDAGRPVQVGAYPQTSIADPVLRVTVDLVRFDAVPNGEAIVDALWTIRRPSDGLVRNGHTVASAAIAGTDYEAIVAGWNVAVATVERDIAAAVVTIGVAMPSEPPADADAAGTAGDAKTSEAARTPGTARNRSTRAVKSAK